MSLDDLGTDDLELPLSKDAQAFVRRCETLKVEADWAHDTVDGIEQTVRQTGVVTDGQRRAIDNIESRHEQGREGRREGKGRRYEGWGR